MDIQSAKNGHDTTTRDKAALFRTERSVHLLEELKEPSRSDDVRSHGLSPQLQLTIRRNQPDHLTRGARSDIDEHVVTAARGVQDRDAVGDATLDALARLAFQDHDDRLGDPSRVNGGSDLVHERSGCSSSIPPPASRTRPDHICCIDKKHNPSLIVTVNVGGTALLSGSPLYPTCTA